MAIIKSIQNAENYKWGDNCDGWHLLKSDSLSVIQERMSPGTSERKHFHNHSQQLFFILSGVATFEIEGQVYIVNSNQSVHIPSGAEHFIANENNQELEFLVISEPKSHGDRVDL
jgi:mannose-6-phosphate isomerase-like protein (cupin superfamily)